MSALPLSKTACDDLSTCMNQYFTLVWFRFFCLQLLTVCWDWILPKKGEWLLTKVSVQITSNYCVFFGFFSLKYVQWHGKKILLMKNGLFYAKLFECEVKSHSSFFREVSSLSILWATDQQYLHFRYCHILTCMQINL